MHKVLVLGAGRVAAPLVKYLLSHSISVTLADSDDTRALALLAAHPLGRAVKLNVTDEAGLDQLVKNHHLVVSLLPYAFHVLVAHVCLRHSRSLVTTSYVQPGMELLDAEARAAGVLLLNEMGLDPGIDHMSAMRVIDRVKSEGGVVESFYSFCGALPAPESVDNPFGYKFSWSPKGVLMAGNNGARFLKDSSVVEIEPGNLFKNPLQVDFTGVGPLEVYPNRDSISYIGLYGLTGIETMMRGTFRYPGWCQAIDMMKTFNLLSDLPSDFTGKSYAEMTAQVAGVPSEGSVKQALVEKFGLQIDSPALRALEWLGLFSSFPMRRGFDSPFEVVSDLMIGKMELMSHERDMVVMQHLFQVLTADGRRAQIKSSMLDYGDPQGDTSIARTVAMPAAIAVRMILEGRIIMSGVHRPLLPEIYNPILDELATWGISLEEELEFLPDHACPDDL